MMQIAVKNQSTVVTDAQLQAALAAFQQQVSHDFAKAWDLDATLHFLPKQSPVPSGYALIVVLDDADQAGALGYHDIQTTGEPLGKVFAKTTIMYGGHWTVTFSHELLEMIADPYINLVAACDRQNRMYAYEVCDAVEDDNFGYMINGILVSDFVLPHWFDEHATRKNQFSFKNHVRAPFQLAPGGYISYLDLGTGQWQQITADLAPDMQVKLSAAEMAKKAHDGIPRPGSRRERRVRGRKGWITSSAE